MIGLIQNKTIYEYDIRSLILAFCMGEKIEQIDEVCSIYDFVLEVFYGEKEVFLKLYEQGQLKEELILSGDYENKGAFKNTLKKGVYQLFSQVLHKELPWGTLTGIRPTKIVFNLFAEGKNKEEVKEYFKTQYFAQEEKADVCAEVVEAEQRLMNSFAYKEGYSLYVGIPFCPSTCLYCSFTSYPISSWKDRVKEYLDAVLKEAKYIGEVYKNKPLQTIYVGGGTPTSLDSEELDYLFEGLRKYFDFSNILEITVEAGRPDSITRNKLEILKKQGVDRISINPQTMNDNTLKVIGRNHTVDEVKETFLMARDVGFLNINMDIICGLPGETMEHLKRTYKEISALDPDSLTVHSLALKRSSKLTQMKDSYSFGVTNEMISFATEKARNMGMNPYYLYRQKNIPGNLENIGFSKEGKECLYNILIMEELHDIIAIGAGTSSKILSPDRTRISRVENLKDIKSYMTRIDEMIHRKEVTIDN